MIRCKLTYLYIEKSVNPLYFANVFSIGSLKKSLPLSYWTPIATMKPKESVWVKERNVHASLFVWVC